MGHQIEFITYYMGRLRFTLTNIIFWIVLVFSCLLSENYAIFSDVPRSGFDQLPLYLLTFAIIGMLIFYYVLEHKKNKLTFDKILLPCLIMFGIIMIWTIFRQGTRTFNNWNNDGGKFDISFTLSERFLAALQVVIWLAILYAIVFVYNRFRLNKESYRWIAKIFLIIIVLFCLIDVFYEWDIIQGIFEGTYQGGGVEFIFGNANVWGLVIFAGIISGLILSYKRFSWYYFSTMIALFCYLLLTTSATAIYISLIVMLAYPIYEIILQIMKNRKSGFIKLAVYLGSLFITVGLIALFVNINIPIFANLWHFVDVSVLHKDFLTMTGRTRIWTHIIKLLEGNPLDFIFGLGHQTGTKIFQTYNATFAPVKSAHNAVMEVFLRYGLLGAIIYCAMLISVFVCLGIHIKHKRYRFAIIYGMAYLAILAHSVSESTNIFTPNIGGVYFGLYYVLPIINVIQEKRFKELKDDLATLTIKKAKIPQRFYFFVGLFAIALVAIMKILNNLAGLDLFSCLVLFVFTIVSTLFAYALLNNQTFININNNILGSYIKRLEVGKYEK